MTLQDAIYDIIKDVITAFYTEKITILDIDNIACARCKERTENGCRVTDLNRKCTQTDEECITLFMEYLEEEGKKNSGRFNKRNHDVGR